MNTDMRNIMKFSKEFLLHPTTVSSIVPSSKALSSTIIDKANLKNAKVIFELGCGSGAITRDIISNLSDGAVFIAFDTNQTFTEILKPGGSFLTYIYLHTFVFPSQNRFRKILSRKFKTIDVSNAVWANLPPAAIIRCTR